MANSNSKDTTGAFDTLDETVSRIRELNEKLVHLAKQQGRVSLDTYEKAPQSLVATKVARSPWPLMPK